MGKKILAALLVFVMVCRQGVVAHGMELAPDVPETIYDVSGGDSLPGMGITEDIIDSEVGAEQEIEETRYAAGVMMGSMTEMKEDVTVPLLQEGAFVDTVGEEGMISFFAAGNWEDILQERLIAAMDACLTEVDISDLQIPRNDENKGKLIDVYADAVNSNGSFFYLSGGFSYWYYPTYYSRITIKYTGPYSDADGNPDMVSINRDKILYEARVAEALSYVKPDMAAIEKALALHDFIVRECDYDYENYLSNTIPWESYSAYGVFVKGLAVCNGYALAYQDLLKRVGIPSNFVSSNVMNHAWNMLYLDGHWYHVDSTWNDPVGASGNGDWATEGRIVHTYFVVSDSEMVALDHNGWSADAPVADHSNSYSGYRFRNYNYPLHYVNGRWYFLENGQITSSRIDGSEQKVFLAGRYFDFLQGAANTLYLADDAGVYGVRVPGTSVYNYKIWSEDPEYPADFYQMDEFAIKQNRLIAVIRDQETGKYSRVELPMDGGVPGQTFTVSFVSNGGSAVPGLSGVEAGTLLTKPTSPKRAGYAFTGWYKDEALTRPWNFEKDTVTANTVLYAKWEKYSIALKQSELTMKPGQSMKVEVSGVPAGEELIWTSGKPEVATVGQYGMVKAVTPGTTTITAALKSNASVSASCLVTVMPTVNTPSISKQGNQLVIQSNTYGSTIYYTTDGSTPSAENGTRVDDYYAIVNTFSGHLKAIAVKDGYIDSAVAKMTLIAPREERNVSFGVKGVFGGRNVTFNSPAKRARIYYSTSTSMLTTSDKSVGAGETLLFEDYYGTIYARTYYNGEWGNVCRLILKIPVVKDPTITVDSKGYATIRTVTPQCHIYYTTDGTTPSMTNGKRVLSSYTRMYVGKGKTVKAIAVRSCFTNSKVVTRKS